VSNFATLVDVIINNEMNGIKHHEHILEIGKTPEILVDKCKFPQITLAIKASVISKICFDHGIATSVIKRLPDIANNPKVLFKSSTQGDSVVVLTFEVKGGIPIIIPIRPNQSSGRKKYNFISSVYAKEGPCPETKWRREGLLIWEK
jgi:hypothetical protein